MSTLPPPAAARQPSLFARFRLNALSYGYAQIVTILAQLVQLPFFVNSWGKIGYSDWLVLTGVPSLFILLDLGISQASANRATICAGAHDWPAARVILQTSFVFALMLGVAIFTLTCAITPLIDWVALLKLHTISNEEARQITLYMALYVGFQFIGGPVDGWFRAMDHAPLGAFLIANRRLADIVITIAVLLCGGGTVALAAAMCACQALLAVGQIMIANRYTPLPVVGIRHASWAEFRAVLKPSLAYASFPLSQAITLQGGVQVLNQLGGPAVVVAYTMARTLMRMIIQFGVVANYALKPEISRLAGQGDMARARAFTRSAALWIMAACVIVYACLVGGGPRIIEIWGRGAVHVGHLELAVIGLHALFNVAWFIPAALLIATNTHVSVATVYAGASCAALAIWLLLAQALPPTLGAALLLLVPETVVLAWLLASSWRSRVLPAGSSDGGQSVSTASEPLGE
ncbi:MATE family efflux transporter [Cupriavidus sp. BIS7]|uniref:lipopolysaccharide biosynthesis protein n=1 Tax=Cupriavidus sp. BIS7 TaxID=1217718 RepID=UPI0002D8D5DA|nr:MATE family efflux transporter [Cupriavidus sp. BIS7]